MPKSRMIAFVCLHGAAKSLVAAEFCKRLGAAKGLGLNATTSGPEPDPEIPTIVVDGLRADGIDVDGKQPQRLSKQDLAKASHIVSFGLDLVGIVDLAKGRVIHRLSGFKEPQGVGYVPGPDRIAVASAGDGSVSLFSADDFGAAGRIELGDDADNIRVARDGRRILVGYGKGG